MPVLAKLNIQRTTPELFIIVALPSYCTEEQLKSHSFFLHEVQANQVPEQEPPDPKMGFFLVIVVSIFFHSF